MTLAGLLCAMVLLTVIACFKRARGTPGADVVTPLVATVSAALGLTAIWVVGAGPVVSAAITIVAATIAVACDHLGGKRKKDGDKEQRDRPVQSERDPRA
jgi:TRAP-type C4-dicarboxylate transport system permease small subunit